MPRGQYDRSQRRESTPVATEPSPVLGDVQEPEVSARALETRRERRRRDDGDLDRMLSLKLAVPSKIQEQLRGEGKVWRWIMDTRMAEAHADDWDVVEGVDPVQANPNGGTAERQVLCSKYADWHEADQRRQEEMIGEREVELMRGNVTDDGKSSAGLRVPDGQKNRITTQRGL